MRPHLRPAGRIVIDPTIVPQGGNVNLARVSKATAAAASAGAASFGTAVASGLGYLPAIGAALASGLGAFVITYRAPANAS